MSFKKIQRPAAVPRPTRAKKDDDGVYTLPTIGRDYLLGGKAIFKVTNVESGESMTFKVRKSHREWPKESGKFEDTYFINVKQPGGKFPYMYLGIMNPETGTIKTTALSAFMPGSKQYATGAWATTVVMTGKSIASTYRIEHLGKCGRCGKALADKSDPRGIHPACN